MYTNAIDMGSYPINITYSLDYFERTYLDFIKTELPNYITYWQELVGLSKIENGVMEGYVLTHPKGKLNKFQKALSDKFEPIRKTCYSVLVEIILFSNFDKH